MSVYNTIIAHFDKNVKRYASTAGQSTVNLYVFAINFNRSAL